MKALNLITGALVVVGGLNWGLVALAEFDLVAFLFGMDFGQTSAITRIVYGLVGLSAVYQATRLGSRRESAALAPHPSGA